MNQSNPKVSVIIPCYNQGSFLQEAVESVLEQTYQNFEIIIINDGSTDAATVALLKNYKQPRTTVIHTNNQGLASARNNGINIAKGKYILPLDADDKIGKNYLQKAIEKLEMNDNLGIVYCEAEFFGHEIGKWELPEYKFPDILLHNVIFSTGFFKKSDWQAIGGYRPNMVFGWEDYDFWLSIIELGKEVYRIPEVLFYYRKYSDSMTVLITNKNFIFSYCQLFYNHPFLYNQNIDVVFTEIVNLRNSIDKYQKIEIELQQLSQKYNQTEIQLEEMQKIIDFLYSSKDIKSFIISKLRSIRKKILIIFLQFFKIFYWTISLQLSDRLRRRKIARVMSNSGLFETGYYWEQNPEIKQLRTEPLGHYLDIGASKGFDPNSLFDTSYYLEQYPDVAALGLNPLAHYITTGAKQNYKSHPLFDTAYYRAQYPDVDESGINPLLHYLTIGIQENRDPFFCLKIEFIPLKLRENFEFNPEIPSSLETHYQDWLNQNYLTQIDLQEMANDLKNLTYQPLISIIMPVFNTPSHYLEEAIQSVLNQVYPNWELCIADDASTEPHIQSILENYSDQDSRIKICFRTKNGHISEASNSAIAIATGQFIALLDHDDLLTPHALYKVVEFLNKYPDADMIYSDEDKIDDEGKLSSAFFKPDWCPDSFLSRMYTCHLGVYRRSLVQQIGGFRVGYEGSQDYDLVLRLTEKTGKIYHIPDVLYHWRIHANSTAQNLDSKNYAIDAAKKALANALQRRNDPGIVTDAPRSIGHYVIRYNIQSYELVSIIIPTKNLGDTLDRCLISIFTQTTYPNFEIILIDNGSTEKRAIEVIETWRKKEPNRLKSFSLDIPFNYSTLNNFAVKQAQGKYLLFLNNDTEVITPDWIEGMVEQAQRPSIGAVGTLLLFPDDTIQHAGVIGGIFYSCGHSHKRFKLGDTGYFNQLNTVNNYSAVTGACIMCRREVFDEIEGFDETFAVNYNDIDLCFKMIAKGYRNIYLPHVMLYHYEAKTRGYDLLNDSKKARLFCEGKYFQTKWKSLIEHDPCYNPHLTIEKEDYSFRV